MFKAILGYRMNYRIAWDTVRGPDSEQQETLSTWMGLCSRKALPFQRQNPNSSSLYVFRSCTTSFSLLPKSLKAVRIAPLSLQSAQNSRWKFQNHLYEHRVTVTLEEYHLSLYAWCWEPCSSKTWELPPQAFLPPFLLMSTDVEHANRSLKFYLLNVKKIKI